MKPGSQPPPLYIREKIFSLPDKKIDPLLFLLLKAKFTKILLFDFAEQIILISASQGRKMLNKEGVCRTPPF